MLHKLQPISINMAPVKIWATALLLASLGSVAFTAQLVAQNGQEIMAQVFAKAKPQSQSSLSQLTIIDKRGARRQRSVLQYNRETAAGTDSFIEFQAPADVRGTRFLAIGHAKENRDDEQRLYLPALGSVRRMTIADKGGSFMGTELYYYDLESKELDDYGSYQYLKSETFRKVPCQVVSTVPSDKNAPYSKMLFWVGQDDHVIYQILAYDNKGRELKKIIFLDVQSFSGTGNTYLIAQKLYIENLQNGNKTLMALSQIQVDQSVPDWVFSPQNLQR